MESSWNVVRWMGLGVLVLAGCWLSACAAAPKQGPAQVGPATPPALYDTKADARADIAVAEAKAKRENQRVVVMFGGNWCGWCRKLHDLFETDKEIAKALQYEYQVVAVDVGRFDKNLDIAGGYGVDLKKNGVPFLTVLSADGKVLANQETGALESGDRHDPEKVLALLNKWKAEPLEADKVTTFALSRAATGKKLVFLHLGAPWCPWCRRLDDFLARKDIAEIVGQDYIDLKIDLDRMTHAAEVAARYRTEQTGGIPWFAILDAEGKVLASSDGPKGNIGYPAQPEEIGYFVGMLKKTSHRITAEQRGRIEKALKEAAAKLPRPAGGAGA